LLGFPAANLSIITIVSCLDGIQSISDLNSLIDERQLDIRQKLGTQSKKKGWYKNVTDGESLGELLFSNMENIEKDRTLYQELKMLLDWTDGK